MKGILGIYRLVIKDIDRSNVVMRREILCNSEDKKKFKINEG